AAALLVAFGAAAAPAIPAAAPTLASAPATSVTPSILDTVMRLNLLGRSIACTSDRGPRGYAGPKDRLSRATDACRASIRLHLAEPSVKERALSSSRADHTLPESP